MKILQNNNDKTILINSETDFGTDLGWEENFQEFEQETLKEIINPAENFETVRYIHSGYTGLEGIYQHDIWFEFYFANYSGGTDGGLNYELIGLAPEDNSKILRTENNSFFRLEFYKVPEGENPNSSNRKLVFTKQLQVPLGEQVYYTPIDEEIYVPVFVGSNYRNKENMYLFWFQDDSVLEGTLLSGNTFYMTTKFYNTIDGTSVAFLNKPKNVSEEIIEEDDMYFKIVIDRSDYSYVVYSGNTNWVSTHRVGVSSVGTPIRCYGASISNSSLERIAFGITSSGSYVPIVECNTSPQSPSNYIFLEKGYSVPVAGLSFYTASTGSSPFVGSTGIYRRIEDPEGIEYAVMIYPSGVIGAVQIC